MTMIVLRLLPLLGLKSRWHRHFSPRPPNPMFFRGGGGVSLDSWTPSPKPLCHRHPTGPHPSGLGWTPVYSRHGRPTRSSFALDRARLALALAEVPGDHLLEALQLAALQELGPQRLADHRVGRVAVLQDLEMQVRPGRAAGRADIADHVALLDPHARRDALGEGREMAVDGRDLRRLRF